MAVLGLSHQGYSLVDELGGGTVVEAQAGAEAGQILPVHKAGAAHGLHAGQLDGMPEVVGQKSQPQGRDEDVVDLIFRVHGAGAGDDVVAPGQCFGPDEFQQQAGDRPVIIPEYHIPVGQRFYRAPVEYHPLGGDG